MLCIREYFLAESVRFELTVGRPITSFQDWLLKPLGQLSICGLIYHFKPEKSRIFPLDKWGGICYHTTVNKRISFDSE